MPRLSIAAVTFGILLVGLCIREGQCDGISSRVARINLDNNTAEKK